MNRFGLQLWEHLVRTRPADLSAITDPTAFFQELGLQIEAEISSTISTSGHATDRARIEAAVVARYGGLHPSDMVTDRSDPLPESLSEHVAMLNREVTERAATDGPVVEPDFVPLSRATEAWLARRPREIVVPVSMIDDPLVRRWRAAGHTITTRAV